MSTQGLLADALDLVHDDLTRYVRFPSAEAADALTLWIAATHCQHLWEHASRFVLKSPVKRCGKTRAAEVTRELVGSPIVAGSISAAALVRSIDPVIPPTLILDETDTVFGKNATSETAEALRQILNLGHSRGWPYIRWDAKSREREECPTFAMAILAGIGDFPDTIEDRAIVVTMQRRAPGEHVEQFRQRDTTSLHTTRDVLRHALKLAVDRWDQSNAYEPPSDMPVADRAADVWEPLLVIADHAGRDWPARARVACVTLTGDLEDEQHLSVKLLTDIRDTWGSDELEPHLATASIIDRLCALEESPWADYYGRRLTPRDLARLLRGYGVRSRTVRLASSTPKGYARADLYPVWTRYTHDPQEAPQAPQAPQATTNDTNTPLLTRHVADVSDVADFPGRASDVADLSDTSPLGEGDASLFESRR